MKQWEKTKEEKIKKVKRKIRKEKGKIKKKGYEESN